MRLDPLIALAQDFHIAADALHAELVRLAQAEQLEEIPPKTREHIAWLARRGCHKGITIASIAQPKVTRG